MTEQEGALTAVCFKVPGAVLLISAVSGGTSNQSQLRRETKILNTSNIEKRWES